MLNLLKFISVLLFASFVAGQARQKITSPNSTAWWVAQSDNVFTWDCKEDGNIKLFNVGIWNKNLNVLPATLTFINAQEDSQCSKLVTVGQLNVPAAVGYTLVFSNLVNNSDVYVSSQEFEIKAAGSLFPTQVTATASTTGAPSPTSSHKSGSISLTAGLGVFSLAAFAIVALLA